MGRSSQAVWGDFQEILPIFRDFSRLQLSHPATLAAHAASQACRYNAHDTTHPTEGCDVNLRAHQWPHGLPYAHGSLPRCYEKAQGMTNLGNILLAFEVCRQQWLLNLKSNLMPRILNWNNFGTRSIRSIPKPRITRTCTAPFATPLNFIQLPFLFPSWQPRFLLANPTTICNDSTIKHRQCAPRPPPA